MEGVGEGISPRSDDAQIEIQKPERRGSAFLWEVKEWNESKTDVVSIPSSEKRGSNLETPQLRSSGCRLGGKASTDFRSPRRQQI